MYTVVLRPNFNLVFCIIVHRKNVLNDSYNKKNKLFCRKSLLENAFVALHAENVMYFY